MVALWQCFMKWRIFSMRSQLLIDLEPLFLVLRKKIYLNTTSVSCINVRKIMKLHSTSWWIYLFGNVYIYDCYCDHKGHTSKVFCSYELSSFVDTTWNDTRTAYHLLCNLELFFLKIHKSTSCTLVVRFNIMNQMCQLKVILFVKLIVSKCMLMRKHKIVIQR